MYDYASIKGERREEEEHSAVRVRVATLYVKWENIISW